MCPTDLNSIEYFINLETHRMLYCNIYKEAFYKE